MAPPKSMEFRFLDTPGLNGTESRDSEHTVSIVNEIVSTRSFSDYRRSQIRREQVEVKVQEEVEVQAEKSVQEKVPV
ncbi:hypothetical protein BGZ81_011367 [Podila clonocystis]|nr:hypothetical protein BGZ81_011367 [Podila clonocystis]